MKNNEENYRNLDTAETLFINQYNKFQDTKRKELQSSTEKFTELLKQIKIAD